MPHTWGSAPTHQSHAHGIVPGGGLSADGKTWVACRPGSFLPVRQCEWAVYAKRPFAGPKAVRACLSRCKRRVAISNSRLLALDERGLTFCWKDHRVKDHTKGKTLHMTMALTPEEYMRRFLLPVLPVGLHRIRHYGLLANGSRKQALAAVRRLLTPAHRQGLRSPPPRAAGP